MLIELELEGDVQLRRRLLRIATRIEHPQPLFRHVADFWMAEERKQFSSEGGHASGGWQELSDATIAAKGHDRILFESGELEESLTTQRAIIEINDDFLLFGSDVDYAGAHQRGAGVPQRRPLELTDSARRETVRKVQLYALRGELR